MSEHAFSEPERHAVYRAIAERRDMRRFVAEWTVGRPLPDFVFDRWPQAEAGTGS